jgi:hypothetical protein
VPTRVAISTRSVLNDAVTDLWIREMRFPGERSDAEQRSKDGRIGYTDTGENGSINLPKDKLHPDHQDHQLAYDHIMPCLKTSGFDAVVWTALTSNYKEKRQRDFSVDDAVNYLENFPEEARERAFDYIRKAPKEVETRLRILIRDRFAGGVSSIVRSGVKTDCLAVNWSNLPRRRRERKKPRTKRRADSSLHQTAPKALGISTAICVNHNKSAA